MPLTHNTITSFELDTALEALHKIADAAPDCVELQALCEWFEQFSAICHFTSSLSPEELLYLQLALDGEVAEC